EVPHAGHRIAGSLPVERTPVRRSRAERPRTTGRRVDDRAVLAEGPPDARLRLAEALLDPGHHLAVAARLGGELEEVRDERLDGLDRDVLGPEAPVVQPGRPQGQLHRLMEGGVV